MKLKIDNRTACTLLGVVDHAIATGEMRLETETWDDWTCTETERSLIGLRDVARQLRRQNPEGVGQ